MIQPVMITYVYIFIYLVCKTKYQVETECTITMLTILKVIDDIYRKNFLVDQLAIPGPIKTKVEYV